MYIASKSRSLPNSWGHVRDHHCSPLPCHGASKTIRYPGRRIIFGLAYRITDAVVPLDCGNIAIIGPQGRGKTTLLEVIARQVSAMDGLMLHISGLYRGQRLTTTEHRPRLSAASTRIAPAPPRLIWLVDDADDLLDPLCCDTQAVRFRQALADSSIIVVFAVPATYGSRTIAAHALCSPAEIERQI